MTKESNENLGSQSFSQFAKTTTPIMKREGQLNWQSARKLEVTGSIPAIALFAFAFTNLKGELKDGQIAKRFKNVFEA